MAAYFDENDDLDEILISFIPEISSLQEIVNGEHPALAFIANKEPVEVEEETTLPLPKLKLKNDLTETLALCEEIWEDVITSIKQDGTYQIGLKDIIDRRNASLSSLKGLLSSDKESFLTLLTKAFQLVKNCENFSLLSEGKKVMWQKFYAYMTSDQCTSDWIKIKRAFVCDNVDLLIYKLFTKLLELVVAKNITAPSTEDIQEKEDKLDRRENNILKYVAGFIQFSMIKRFERTSGNELNQKFTKSLLSWSQHKDLNQTCFNFKDEWVEIVNRGGLVDVNDEVFLFFRAIEYCVRRVFNVVTLRNYVGQNLKNVLTQQVIESVHVINRWDRVVQKEDLSSEEKEKLLKIIVVYWINMRGRSFVRAWVDRLRSQKVKAISKKGEHSLRKQLNTSSKKK